MREPVEPRVVGPDGGERNIRNVQIFWKFELFPVLDEGDVLPLSPRVEASPAELLGRLTPGQSTGGDDHLERGVFRLLVGSPAVEPPTGQAVPARLQRLDRQVRDAGPAVVGLPLEMQLQILLGHRPHRGLRHLGPGHQNGGAGERSQEDQAPRSRRPPPRPNRFDRKTLRGVDARRRPLDWYVFGHSSKVSHAYPSSSGWKVIWIGSNCGSKTTWPSANRVLSPRFSCTLMPSGSLLKISIG